MKKINWSNVFNTSHHIYGDLATAWNAAKDAEYPYILWSDRVFETKEFKETGWELVKGEFVDMSVDDDEILFV
jgi:hypothetical protein